MSMVSEHGLLIQNHLKCKTVPANTSSHAT